MPIRHSPAVQLRDHCATARSALRSGYALVETLAAMAVLATLMTLGATTIWTTLKVERFVDGERQLRRDWHRLAVDFRRDAAQAQSVDIDAAEGHDACRLTDWRGVTTHYAAADRGVRRTSTTTEGRPTVEDFRVSLDPQAAASFRAADRWITLELSWQPSSANPSQLAPRTKHLTARVARDLRWSNGGRDDAKP